MGFLWIYTVRIKSDFYFLSLQEPVFEHYTSWSACRFVIRAVSRKGGGNIGVCNPLTLLKNAGEWSIGSPCFQPCFQGAHGHSFQKYRRRCVSRTPHELRPGYGPGHGPLPSFPGSRRFDHSVINFGEDSHYQNRIPTQGPPVIVSRSTALSSRPPSQSLTSPKTSVLCILNVAGNASQAVTTTLMQCTK